MEISLILLRKYLGSLNDLDYSNLNEYQNKYYLTKKIQERFPAITSDIIYEAIEATNRAIDKPILTRKYISNLCKVLLLLHNDDR